MGKRERILACLRLLAKAGFDESKHRRGADGIYLPKNTLKWLNTAPESAANKKLILQKGGKLPVGSVRVWGGKEYVKVAPGEWRPRVKHKEDSTEQAKELALSMFGTPEEVREMAKMERKAESYDEAREMVLGLVNKPLQSRSGLVATLSKKSVDKILSGTAVGKSFDKDAHLLAAANIDKLFSNAAEPFKFPLKPEKHNENYRAVRRLYSPMLFEKRIIPVKFTVLEMLNPKDGKRLYSLEAIDVDLDKK
ncbi:MAG: hypothetical protein FWG66_11115 [Spirochaetes bacterium]|nr:hypothetical protein [Spirochaetota bacterium]